MTSDENWLWEGREGKRRWYDLKKEMNTGNWRNERKDKREASKLGMREETNEREVRIEWRKGKRNTRDSEMAANPRKKKTKTKKKKKKKTEQ